MSWLLQSRVCGKNSFRFTNKNHITTQKSFSFNNIPSNKRNLHIFNDPPEEFVERRQVDNFIPEPEKFEHRLLLNVGRHTKVTRGGRIFSVSVLVILGDGEGTGGIGYAKGETMAVAMKNAVVDAQKNAFTIDLNEGRTLSEPTIHKFRRSIMYVWPLPKDRGMLCNNIFRRISDAFGIKDIRIKSQGSRNPHNMYRCLLQTFQMCESHKTKAQKIGLKYFDMVKAVRVNGRDRAF